MTRSRSAKVAVAAGVTVLAVLAGTAFGSSMTSSARPTGITVHGRWTLVVRSRSGRIVARIGPGISSGAAAVTRALSRKRFGWKRTMPCVSSCR